MNCPRCKKDAIPQSLSLFQWLETAGLDAQQTAFMVGCYGHPLCDECLYVLKSGFYTCETNPYLTSSKTRKS